MIKKIISVFLCLCLCFFATSSWPADYPTRSIQIIVPMAPGGNLDLQARAFATVAEKYLGKPVMVVNKAGASGMIGGLAGAQAPPDGYTLTVGTPAITNAVEWEVVNGRKPTFTLQKDFAPIGSFALSPSILVVPINSPWKTLADLIRDARAKPEFYAFSSAGNFSGSHTPTVIFMRATGLQFRHVPMTGGSPALTAVVGNHVDFSTQWPAVALPLVVGKKVRALAVLGEKRLKTIPDVPTAKELGVNAEYYGWAAIMAPKKTPLPIVEKLRDAAKKVSADKTFNELIEKTGDEVDFMSGEGLAKFWDAESAEIRKMMVDIKKEETGKAK